MLPLLKKELIDSLMSKLPDRIINSLIYIEQLSYKINEKYDYK